jgi:hypothetical protein
LNSSRHLFLVASEAGSLKNVGFLAQSSISLLEDERRISKNKKKALPGKAFRDLRQDFPARRVGEKDNFNV